MIITTRLEGPLQSYGDGDCWNIRRTNAFPTLSAIVGMVGAAMGLERDDKKLEHLSQTITLAVRADAPGTKMFDFQMSARQKNAFGKDKGNGWLAKEYLQDAKFFVAIDVLDEVATDIIAAFQSPVYSPSLGRKVCVPSRPILWQKSKYETLQEAIEKEPIPGKEVSSTIRYQFEYPHAYRGVSDGFIEKGLINLNDEPLEYEIQMRDTKGTKRALKDCAQMHKLVQGMFRQKREDGQTIYRIVDKNNPRLLIRSSGRPNFSNEDIASVKRTTISQFTKGQRCSFSITVSPTYRSNGKRVRIKDEMQQRHWLKEKALQNGFIIDSITKVTPSVVRGRKANAMVYFNAITCDVTITITDAAAFQKAYTQGIGPGKAYGIGMII